MPIWMKHWVIFVERGRSMIEIINKSECCGCHACFNICPRRCISMEPDDEGFLYPIVKVDKCIGCGLCEKVCPIINKEKCKEVPIAFVGQHKSDKILSESTSGGVFSAIAQYIEDKQGVICGAVFTKDFSVKHKCFKSLWGGMRNSKYSQSNLGTIFQEIQDFLEKGLMVCFSGTPCQVEGLKSFLLKDYKNLITIDIVCRSIPSPKLWGEYLSYLEDKHHSKIKGVKFRNKTYGYHSGSFIATFENGEMEGGSNRVNPYMKAFHMNICSRPSCYNCKFKTIERKSDFTIFDCWRPDLLVPKLMDNNKGYSGILVHSQKGLDILEKIKTDFEYYQVNYKAAIGFTGGMVENSVSRPVERESFYQELNKNGFKYTMNRYVPVTFKDRVIEYFKAVTYKFGVLDFIKNRLKL